MKRIRRFDMEFRLALGNMVGPGDAVAPLKHGFAMRASGLYKETLILKHAVSWSIHDFWSDFSE